MNFSECKKQGFWPDWFLKNLVSACPNLFECKGDQKLVWCCPVHGEFSRAIKTHLVLEGRCPKCSMESSTRNLQLSRRASNPFSPEFLKSLEGSPDKDKVLNLELRTKDRAWFNCPKHGLYKQLISGRISGKCGCPECLSEKRCKYPSEHKSNSFQENPFLSQPLPSGFLSKRTVIKYGRFPDYFIKDLVSDIPSVKTPSCKKLIWNCSMHGHYEMSIKSKLKGHLCPVCTQIEASSKHRETLKNKRVFPDSLLSQVDVSSLDRIKSGHYSTGEKANFVCSLHGVYSIYIGDFLRGHRCPLCGRLRGSSVRQFNARQNNPFPQWFIDDLEGSPDKDRVLSAQLTSHDKALFFCKEHGFYSQIIGDHFYSHKGCPSCAAIKVDNISSYEKRLYVDLSCKCLRSYRGLIFSPLTGKGMELDLYFPEQRVAVEVNGVYYHSYDRMQEVSQYSAIGGKSNYHRMKTELCKQKGVRLIHLFEDSLRDRYDVCLSLIKSKLGILNRASLYARKLSLRIVSIQEAKKFLNNTHIQGYGQGECFGLYYQELLVSLIQVKRAASNTVDSGSHILDRYATLSDYFVIGGFERLLTAAERTLNIKRWISYADLCVSNGDLYYHNGWVLIDELPVDYQYVYHDTRYHKFNFRIQRFKNDPNLKYEEGLTEFQLAQLNRIRRIYDCGKLKFEKIVK